MSSLPDWRALEAEIRLLLGAAPQDRQRLLDSLRAYSARVVSEARRLDAQSPAVKSGIPDWLYRPVFICGHHRSGTTLLQSLLDGHPDLVVLPSEGTYLSSFRYVASENPPSSSVDRFMGAWIERFISPNTDPHFKLGLSTDQRNPSLQLCRAMLAWQRALLGLKRDLVKFRLMLALVAAYAEQRSLPRGPARWVEKTPLNECNLSEHLAFQDARYIQMVREPTATLASLRAAYSGSPERFQVLRHVRAIANSFRLARLHERRHRARYLVVRYEDLTTAPAREMDRIREFLGISAHPTLLIPTSLGQPVASNSSFLRSSPGVIACRPEAMSSATPQDDELVRVFCGQEAQARGYHVHASQARRRRVTPAMISRAILITKYSGQQLAELMRGLGSDRSPKSGH